jgi:outer membrane scaffolding protein for murein synthesis (MipA/OmpV family)
VAPCRRAAARRIAWLGGLWLATYAWPGLARAAEEPLWEFGLGAGLLVFNDYRGSSSTHALPLPVPYVIYRGSFLRSDRDGVHGLLFNHRYLQLELSVNATAPVFSSSSGTRAGMPALAPTIEIGPALQWHLWRDASERLRLDVRLPVREAVTIASRPDAIGAIFAPSLNLDCLGSGRAAGWNFGLLAGPLYAQRRYHDYFYAVAAQYATPTRPAYEPAGGYSGSEALLSTSRRFGAYWFGAYVRHDWLAGAAFGDSPLVQQRQYWTEGVGFVWMISASKTMVESND